MEGDIVADVKPVTSFKLRRKCRLQCTSSLRERILSVLYMTRITRNLVEEQKTGSKEELMRIKDLLLMFCIVIYGKTGTLVAQRTVFFYENIRKMCSKFREN